MPMQIVERSGEGLSRVYAVTVPAQDLADKLDARVTEIRPRMQIKGFRPGKVPAAHVKRLHGKALMGEIVEQAVNESQQQALSESRLRPAANPDVKVESDIDKVLAGGADLVFELAVEVMPEFEPVDVATLTLTRPVHAPSEEDVESELRQLADRGRVYEPKGDAAEAAEGDQVIIDFVGRIDGEAFEGGAAEDAPLVIGSGQFIPGFEEQLKAAKAGDDVLVHVVFPDAYQAEALRGKAAVFEVKVKEVRAPVEGELDDAFAVRIGFETLDKLKDAIRGQMAQQYAGASRYKAKRALLDVLDQGHAFPLPSRMVESEFGVIWSQVEQERERGELSEEDAGKTDEQLRAEYRKIAERRVRLGLVLAEIGQRNNVQVTEQEMQQALLTEARRYPGQEKQIFDFYRANPQASAQLRAPIYEEKVVDLILERAQVTDEQVSKTELFKDDEMPEGYGDAEAAPAEEQPVEQQPTVEAQAPAEDQPASQDEAAAPPKARKAPSKATAPAAEVEAEPAADAKPKKPRARKPKPDETVMAESASPAEPSASEPQ